jgi:nitrate/nitrite transport system permease protein
MSTKTPLATGDDAGLLPAGAAATGAAGPVVGRLLSIGSRAGLGGLTPLIRFIRGDDRPAQLAALWRDIGVPLAAVVLFLGVWSWGAGSVETSLGRIPGPTAVWTQARGLWSEHVAERAREAAFYERQAARNAELAASGAAPVPLTYTGKPTYLDQILTSLVTVFTGFVLASLVAVPVGVLSGLSATIRAGVNPFIQIFKPVSPLAWLPIVTMVVSATYTSSDPLLQKSFINSAITVALCSLWPTLVNTALGVSSIDRDLLNVAKVLRLNWWTKLIKVVIPSSLPLIFTGLRLSLGVGWMVLIAAEMLAQNPGLGKFVWDEFQNGSSDSLGRIMVAVFTIGLVGFLLDRLMLTIHSIVDFGARR